MSGADSLKSSKEKPCSDIKKSSSKTHKGAVDKATRSSGRVKSPRKRVSKLKSARGTDSDNSSKTSKASSKGSTGSHNDVKNASENASAKVREQKEIISTEELILQKV